MAARIIPVEQSRSIEVWHDAAAKHSDVAHEDRLIAISVALPRQPRKAERNEAARADWPPPLLDLMRQGAQS